MNFNFSFHSFLLIENSILGLLSSKLCELALWRPGKLSKTLGVPFVCIRRRGSKIKSLVRRSICVVSTKRLGRRTQAGVSSPKNLPKFLLPGTLVTKVDLEILRV